MLVFVGIAVSARLKAAIDCVIIIVRFTVILHFDVINITTACKMNFLR